MPLVQQYKGARILKAKRAKFLRGRPAWQTADPGSSEGRKAYAIAAKYENKFGAAFLSALRAMFTKDTDAAFKKAFATGSMDEMMRALPLAEDSEDPVWERFREKIEPAYGDVIRAAGDDATRRMNKQFGTDIGFTLESEPPAPKVEILKVRVVPVNPYSIKWIKEHVLELINQGMAKSQREVVAATLLDAFERGLRVENVMDEIKANIGLTLREHKAVVRRREMLKAKGIKKKAVGVLSAKYAGQLLKKRAARIARTETIAAQSQGRHAAWKNAQDAGMLPEVQRRWLSAGPSANPDSPCEICLDLDNETAKLGEPYESAFLGPVMHPGPESHPGCRCTETLERV